MCRGLQGLNAVVSTGLGGGGGGGGELCCAMILQGFKEIISPIIEAFHVWRKIRGFAMKA